MSKIRDIELKKVKQGKLPKIKKTFWEKPLGRTLKASNRTGKIVYSIVGAITGVPILTIANINIMDFADLNIIQIIVTVLFFIVSGVVGLYVKSPGTKKKLNELADVLEKELVKATDEASDSGKKITRKETRSIIQAVIGSVFG